VLCFYAFCSGLNIPPLYADHQLINSTNRCLEWAGIAQSVPGCWSLARPTSRCILFDGENISFDANLVIYINGTNIQSNYDNK
jgi:hypothetical protein